MNLTRTKKNKENINIKDATIWKFFANKNIYTNSLHNTWGSSK